MNHHPALPIAGAFLMLTAASTAKCESLAQASKAFDDAQFRHDGRTIDRFLAPDFLFITGAGKALGRADFIAGATTPGEKLKSLSATTGSSPLDVMEVWSAAKDWYVVVKAASRSSPISDMLTYSLDGTTTGSWCMFR